MTAVKKEKGQHAVKPLKPIWIDSAIKSPVLFIKKRSVKFRMSFDVHTFASSNLPNAFNKFPRSLRTQYKSWNAIDGIQLGLRF